MAISKLWSNRIKSGNKAYNIWSNQFKCKTLEQYYEGKQWQFNTFFTDEPYKVNLIYSTIKIKAANLILSYPQYKISPKPGNMDWNQEVATLSASLKEDVLNTVISNDKEAIAEVMQLCFLDSMFRFGVMEVGYANDWLRNPLASIPLRKDQVTKVNKESEDLGDEDPKIALMPEELPQNEQIYFRHISAKRFRVGAHDNVLRLNRADWFGYYDFVLKKDLQVIKGIKSDKLDDVNFDSSKEAAEYAQIRYSQEDEEKAVGQVVKVWHAWDPRAMKRYLILDSPCEVIWEEKFKRIPIPDLRWDLRLSSWYPIPPVWQWISPQNEYNEGA